MTFILYHIYFWTREDGFKDEDLQVDLTNESLVNFPTNEPNTVAFLSFSIWEANRAVNFVSLSLPDIKPLRSVFPLSFCLFPAPPPSPYFSPLTRIRLSGFSFGSPIWQTTHHIVPSVLEGFVAHRERRLSVFCAVCVRVWKVYWHWCAACGIESTCLVSRFQHASVYVFVCMLGRAGIMYEWRCRRGINVDTCPNSV